MRIAIVNDVAMIVEILARVITEHTEHDVAWTATNGHEAVEKCRGDRPDIILMDLIMPEMDGIEATRRIMDATPCAILVVTASVNSNAGMVFEAMAAGALDAINTPTLGGNSEFIGLDMFQKKISTIGKLIARSTPLRPKIIETEAVAEAPRSHLPLIAIGSSTGGPGALAKILTQMPRDLDAGVVIIQHVDSQFAPGLANWLNEQGPVPVRLAEPGDRPRAGQVLIAGTSDHLVLQPNGRLDYSAEPKDYVYRPSVDVFFNSAVDHWPSPIIGVLLTGMGRDGANGLLALRRKHMYTIAQNQATCAVYGMPKAAVELNAAEDILPIDDIGPALLTALIRMREHSAIAGAHQ